MKNGFTYFIVFLAWFLAGSAAAQQVNDAVELSSSNQAGVPVHPADGEPGYVRWPNGTRGKVTAIGTQTGWRCVESNGKTGWVTSSYLTILPPAGTDPEDPAEEMESIVIGTWNLEWLHNGKNRGFPEYTRGGPTYGPRTDSDYRLLAETIRDRLMAGILVLSEINGATPARSNELDRLIRELGGRWGYYLAPSPGQQRLAVLFDSNAAICSRCLEMEVPNRKIQGKDIFDRNPLVCSFTLTDQDQAGRNDLLLVAVHLASGQDLNANHDTAMAVLSRTLEKMMRDGTFKQAERDVLIAGDFNASRYDNKPESLWTGTSPGYFQFRTLSPENGEDYPGTRLAGVPLAPVSQIDYIMVSACAGGLTEEIAEPSARVRTDLLPADFNEFRKHLSDHIPVTVKVRITADRD